MATATNTSAAKPKIGGAIYVAPTTATMPTSTTATLTGFTCLGYISEDGLTNSNSPSSEIIKAWGGDPVLQIIQDREDTFSFTLMEVLNADVLKLVYGDSNVTESNDAITVSVNGDELGAKAFVFDMVMRGNKAKRIVIPSAFITEVGDITYSDSDAVGYEITIQAQRDATGHNHYEYIA